MTITMPDSITPGNLPMGYPAYLGYVDGKWPTALRLPELFPGARVLGLTVTGSTLSADGIDCEEGNPNAHRAAVWIHDKLEAAPASRPVAYADLLTPGYSMAEVIAGLLALGVQRSQYRVLTAHYTGEAHICSPATCDVSFQADGTQWTSKYPGIGGADIDMSLLDDGFFGSTVSTGSTFTEKIVKELPIVKQGQTGDVVRTVQGLCNARLQPLIVDGAFGPKTTAAVKNIQAKAKISVDGIVGPLTWPKLFGVLRARRGVPGRRGAQPRHRRAGRPLVGVRAHAQPARPAGRRLPAPVRRHRAPVAHGPLDLGARKTPRWDLSWRGVSSSPVPRPGDDAGG